MIPIARRIADELQVRVSQVEATIALLDDKSTVPFIARYRKEATGGLDDTQLRALAERLAYLRELEDRRAAIIESITAQGKLTPELAAVLDAADTKARLEDLYLPYKPKRRTRAQIAREAGLEPLAHGLLQKPHLVPEDAAAAYVDPEKGVADAAAALEGARWILMEQFSEDAELVGGLRQLVWERGEWRSTVVPGKETEGVKFSDYFNATERLKSVPSHRVLALLRGRKEAILRLAVVLPVPRVGDRAFQQAAGFLRVTNGDNPLDASAVHPEAYAVVERIVARTGVGIRDLIGASHVLRTLEAAEFADAQFGVPTVKDILVELDKPGRDPRPEFRTAAFKDVVQAIGDLAPGMELEGVVTNVANFGAFVDIGVHQDGLVHVSQLADRFVKDPRDIVKAGDIVRVKVVDVDLPRKRIALTMKLQDSRGSSQAAPPAARVAVTATRPLTPAAPQTSLGAAFAKLKG